MVNTGRMAFCCCFTISAGVCHEGLRSVFVLPAVVVRLESGFGPEFTYSKIDESVAEDNGTNGAIGWGSCVTCAGGVPTGTASLSTSPFITSPSVDGASRDFYISGSAYTNGLWWYKVGSNDAVSHFKMDFWLNVTSDTRYAQALEFDVFQHNKQITQFASGTRFMFGTQCNYAAGVWDVWDAWRSQMVAHQRRLQPLQTRHLVPHYA